jgi:hypothetical protein
MPADDGPGGPAPRLWRLRRRHDHIDAVLIADGAAWILEYRRNDRQLMTWRFSSRADADAEADRRRRDLQRAGWTLHW